MPKLLETENSHYYNRPVVPCGFNLHKSPRGSLRVVMPNYLILAQDQSTARALGAIFDLQGEPPLDHPDLDPRCEVLEHFCSRLGVDGFNRLSLRIENALQKGMGEDLVVLVDAVRLSNLNPLNEAATWDTIIAMLILAFPEVRWVFGSISVKGLLNDAEKIIKSHSLGTFISPIVHDPLFDPTGLRSLVRMNANRALGNVVDPISPIPVRNASAAAIDDEEAYALLHAYSAYRFGFLADAVTSWTQMRELFQGSPGIHGYSVLFEDINLHFPDRPEQIHLSDFQKRGAPRPPGMEPESCPALGYDDGPWSQKCFRIIVTGGYSGSGTNTAGINKAWLDEHQPGYNGLVMKPVGGIFDFWRKSGLLERLCDGKAQGQSKEFHWPPQIEDGPIEASRHSAPGKLMLLATHLVRRADALRQEASLVRECLRGAVLATDALELLGFRTPTLALQALCLKHEFEVKAEVAFMGVGHHFELELRFQEMGRDVEIAANFFQQKRRSLAYYDSLVSIINRIMLVFREAGQFDEEQECLRRQRRWNRMLSFHRHARNPGMWAINIILGYAELLVSSFPALIFAVLGWWLVLTLAWLAIGLDWSWPVVVNAIKATIGSFIGANLLDLPEKIKNSFGTYPLKPEHWAYLGQLGLSLVSAIIGYFHLGVFVSYFYSTVARK